jgi:hypothetical protein
MWSVEVEVVYGVIMVSWCMVMVRERSIEIKKTSR